MPWEGQRRTVLTRLEYSALLTAARRDTAATHTLAALLGTIGLRVGEAVNINVTDLRSSVGVGAPDRHGQGRQAGAHPAARAGATGARAAGLLARNAAIVPTPPGSRAQGRSTAVEQAAALLIAARGHPLEAAIVLGLTCGLRLGELLALRWDDVDWTAPRPSAVIRIGGTVQLGHPANLRRGLRQVTEQAVGRWHPHELPHSAASLLSAAGVPLAEWRTCSDTPARA